MKSSTVFHILASTIALLGSLLGVQAATSKSGHNFAAAVVTSTLTAFGTRFSTLPTISSSPSTATTVISAAVVAVNISKNQVSTTSVVELTRTRTSTISTTLSRTLSATEVNIPTPSVRTLSTSALASDAAATPLPPISIHSIVPSPTSSRLSKQTGSSSHAGIFVSLLSSVHSIVVLPANSLLLKPPPNNNTSGSNRTTTMSQLPINPVQKVGLTTTANSDIDKLTISSWPTTAFRTIYTTMAHTFTVTTSLLLSDPSPSDRSSNATAQSLLDLLATAPSSKENTTLTRILSTAINVVTVLSLTTLTSSLVFGHNLSTSSSSRLPTGYNSTYSRFPTVPPTTIFSSILSSNLPPSDSSTFTKVLAVQSATTTQQSFSTNAAALDISAPHSTSSSSSSSLSSSSHVSIFRGIFQNFLLPSTSASADDSSFAPPTTIE